MRVAGVALVALVLALLAAAAVRGVRRAAWPHDVEGAGRSLTRGSSRGWSCSPRWSSAPSSWSHSST